MDSAAAGRKRSALLATLTRSLQLWLSIGYWLFAAQAAFGQGVVNVDFSRDISAQNPGGNPAPILFTGTGPSSDLGTTWNDLRVPLSISGDQGADTIANPFQFNNLDASDGTTTTIDLDLTSGFFRAFNGPPAASSATIAALQNERVFSNSGNLATLTLKGLDPARQYDLYLINSGSFATAYTIGATSKTASGNSFDGDWTDGVEHAYFAAVNPDASGEIAIGIQDGSAPINSFGTISGIQIVPLNTQPVNFLYPSSASSNGGQFNA